MRGWGAGMDLNRFTNTTKVDTMRALLLICAILSLQGCAMLRGDGLTVYNIDKQEVQSHRSEAEARLGMSLSRKEMWVYGIDRRNYDDPMTGQWRDGVIVYYLTHGHVGLETGVRQWAHQILHDNGLPYEEHQERMRETGIL